MDSWIGPAAATVAAVCWAVSTALFERVGHVLPAWLLNLSKGSIASVLLGLTIYVLGQAPPGAARAWIWLTVSGIIGLGLGDTAYFISLRHLGHRRSLLMMLLAPIFAGLIALVAMHEVLSPGSWLGIGITLAGLGWVIAEQDSDTTSMPVPALPTADVPVVASSAGAAGEDARDCPATSASRVKTSVKRPLAGWSGVTFGLIAAVAQAVGAVISRDVMQTPDVTPLWASLIRLVAGAAVLAPMLLWRRTAPMGRRSSAFPPGPMAGAGRPQAISLALRLLAATLIGTCVAIWLQQTAFKYSDTAIAQTLLSTCPLFALPIAAWRGERVSSRAILGAMVAVVGVAVFLSN